MRLMVSNESSEKQVNAKDGFVTMGLFMRNSFTKQRSIRFKGVERTGGRFAGVAAQFNSFGLVMALGALFFAGCSAGTPPPARPDRSGPSLPAASTQPAPTPVPVKQADVALLQKSVARVLGFTDIGGIALTLYQDSGSALYNNLAAQQATVEGTVGDPIFYHSPVFVAEPAKLIALSDGRIEVTINNQYTQEAVRRAIASDLGDVLAAYKIEVGKIGLIPVTDVTVNVNAFGKDYKDAELDEEFRTISFSLPSADIPQYILDQITSTRVRSEAGQAFLENLSAINISYGYFVQQYGQQQCQMNIGNEEVRDMYMDQEGCPPGPTADEMRDGLEFAMGKKGVTAADSINAKLAALMTASSAVTACAAGNEARKLQARASVSCTKKGEEDFSPIVLDFLQNTIQPSVQSLSVMKNNVADWDDKLIEAVVQMFGSPERFVSEVDEINSEIQNKSITELDNDYYSRAQRMADTLRNHDVFNQSASYVDKQGRLITSDLNQVYNNSLDSSTRSNAKGGGGSLNFGFDKFRAGGKSENESAAGDSSTTQRTDYLESQNASDEFMRDYNEFHNIAKSINLATDTEVEDAQIRTSEYLYDYGFDHTIEKVDGEWKIFPRLNIAVKAAKSSAENFAQNVQTNELGEIVLQRDNFPVQLVEPEPAQIVVRLKCDGASASWTGRTKSLTQYRWWLDDSFWHDLSDRIAGAFQSGGCPFLAVQMYYRNAEENLSMVPKFLDLSIHGLIEEQSPAGADGTPGQMFFTKSRPIAVELRRENTAESPSDGSIQVCAGSTVQSSDGTDECQPGKVFNKISIVR
jgi:hypothetical protein